MSIHTVSGVAKSHTRKLSAWMQAAVIASAGLLPVLSTSSVSAGTLSGRKLTMSSSVAGNAIATDATNGVGTGVDHVYDFTLDDASTLGSIELLYCTTPLGTCVAPAGLTVIGATLDTATDTINGSDAALADGTNTANLLQVTKIAAAASGIVHLEFNGITNPNIASGAYTSFYVRINVYSDSAYTTSVDNGTVAGAVTQQLVVNGRVQERLEFCVAAIDDGDATPADCAAFPTTFTIDIGVIQEAATESPVDNDGFNGANDDYGVVMVDTNAATGVVISYFPESDNAGTNQLRNFRVDGATTCSATETDTDDPCFQSAATTGTDISATAGEFFGMQVACVDVTASENSTSNLANNNASYNGDASDVTCEDTEVSTTYAWDNSGTPVTLASSSSVVNDEMLKVRFGARAAATTPTGSYSVTTTYVATATF